MSLTLALGALGAAVLVGVAVHGAWTSRKLGLKTAPGIEPGAQGPRGRTEPSFGEGPVDAAAHSEPGFDDALAAVDARPLRRRLALRIDALIDAIVPITVESPLAGEQAIAHLPPSHRAGSKPFMIEGRDVDSGDWEALRPGRRYAELQAGIQLANRHGALNEIEFSEFVQKIERFALGIGAAADVPDMLDAVARARELDAFAGDHDAQLAVQLRARGAAWSVAYLQQQAARQGFVPGVVPGRLILPSDEEGAPPLLTLVFDAQAALADDPNQSAVRDATLGFDVPQTDAAARPFDAWRASAIALSQGMEADVVDDSGQALTEPAFEAIARDLERLYATLEARDLAAGSNTARRLFS